MVEEVLNCLKTLVLPCHTQAEIEAMAANAQMGSLFYDTTNNKLIFIKAGGGHEHVTSA